jgi:hypothetical protein
VTIRQEKYNIIDSENRIQIPIIKEQIVVNNKKIDHQKKKDHLVRKKANYLLFKIWDQQQKDVIHSINNVKCIILS